MTLLQLVCLFPPKKLACLSVEPFWLIYCVCLGGSANAAADLVKQLKGQVMGFMFILEIPGLNGRDKLDKVPTTILLEDA